MHLCVTPFAGKHVSLTCKSFDTNVNLHARLGSWPRSCGFDGLFSPPPSCLCLWCNDWWAGPSWAACDPAGREKKKTLSTFRLQHLRAGGRPHTETPSLLAFFLWPRGIFFFSPVLQFREWETLSLRSGRTSRMQQQQRSSSSRRRRRREERWMMVARRRRSKSSKLR